MQCNAYWQMLNRWYLFFIITITTCLLSDAIITYGKCDELTYCIFNIFLNIFTWSDHKLFALYMSKIQNKSLLQSWNPKIIL